MNQLSVYPANEPGYMLQHVAAMMHRQADQILQENLGLGMSQFRLLMILQNHPHIQQRTIAKELGQTEASISRQVSLLSDRGMLAVRVNPASKREHITVLTPKGQKLTDASLAILGDYHEPLFKQFDEKQLAQFKQLLEILHTSVCSTDKSHACNIMSVS